MTQKTTHKEYSIKQLRSQLEYLTEELRKTTEKIQLQEIFDTSKFEITSDAELEQEISELIKKQNVISHEIITVKKKIKKLSAKTILKTELLILPIVVVLLFFVTTNYLSQPVEQGTSIKTHYVIEDLQGSVTNNYQYWDIQKNSPLNVNINNSANVNEQKIRDVENAILSTDVISKDGTVIHSSDAETDQYFTGWRGAVKTTSVNSKHTIPTNFNLIQSNNGEGDIVITLSTLKAEDGYSGVTRTIVDGNQILKAFITIYDSDKLSDTQLESIVRYEFGYALGLPHTNNAEGLMGNSITTNNSYITKCDINTLEKVYNDEQPSENFCNN